jgi:hypothetical protein
MSPTELTELKKFLYKNKPYATFTRIVGRVAYWETEFDSTYTIKFAVPFSEMGDSEFTNIMPAQLLIRYIVDTLLGPGESLPQELSLKILNDE